MNTFAMVVVLLVVWLGFRLLILRPILGFRGLRLFDATIWTIASAYYYANGKGVPGTAFLVFALWDALVFLAWKEPIKP